MHKKVILAYSGGLDTSVILKWLLNRDFEVICFVANVGQKENFEQVRQKALTLGASRVYIEDLREEFVEQYIFQALKANALYEGKYMLGTSLARPLIAKKQIEIARGEKCSLVAHGATGKGNDQVRFEIAYLTLMPDVTIIAPWRDSEFLDQFKGRSDLIAYAQQLGIPVAATLKKPYSLDENLMHISYEGDILENPSMEAPKEMFLRTTSPQEAPDIATHIKIDFKGGTPVSVTHGGTTIDSSPLALFEYLNTLCSANGIGRVDLVENRFVGMKSRGVYETPAATALWKAHLDLEGLVLDREVLHLKESLMPKIAQLIYNGFWFSPEMDFLMAAINQSQIQVDGEVHMALYKGNCYVTRRSSPKSLYRQNVASMDRLGNYDQGDAKGFIKLQALRFMRCI